MKDNQKNPKNKKSFNWRTLVWPKYVTSLAVIALASAITIGIIKYNSTKPHLAQGYDNNLLKNKFVNPNGNINLADGPRLTFVNSEKNHEIATFDPSKGEDGEVFYNNNWIGYNDFLKQFYEKNHSMPFLNIKYGMFDFYNEYIEAVSAKDFYDFTQWFMKNVSWGPEIITLKEFSIVKGVELNGNNITLGSHSNQDKEYTTIKFFPDAFFGSIPLHSTLSGEGNAADSLLYRVNKKLLTFPELQKFLENINEYNSFTNISQQTSNAQSFRTLADKRDLIGKEVFVVKGNYREKIESEAFSTLEKDRLNVSSDYISLVVANTLEEAQTKFAEYVKSYSKNDPFETLKNSASFSFEKKTIVNAIIENDEKTLLDKINDKYLKLIFNDGKTFILFNSIDEAQYNVEIVNGQITNGTRPQNTESIQQALERNTRAFENLSSDISSIYAKNLTNNIYLQQDKLAKFIEFVNLLKEKDTKEVQINETNKLIQKGDDNHREELNLYKQAKERSLEEINKVNQSLKEKQNKKSELEAEIAAENNEQTKENKNYELFKLNKEIEELNARKQEYEQVVTTSTRRIETLESEIPTDEQLREYHARIAGLNQEIRALNIEQKREEILLILKRAFFDSEQLDTLIDLYKLNEEIENSEFKEPKTEFDSIDQKADYIRNLYKFILENRAKYNLYSKILSGDVYAKIENVNDEYLLYSSDLGYLPAQLIALDELVKITKNWRINWREYSNLNGFIRSHNETVSNGFYVYLPNINSIREEYQGSETEVKQLIDKENARLDEILKSFENNEQLNQQKSSISSHLEQANYSSLVNEFKQDIQTLDTLATKYNKDTQAFVRIMTLKSFVEYEDDTTKDKKYYNDIKDIIEKDSALSSHWNDFDSAINNIDTLRKITQNEKESYKLKITSLLPKMFNLYSEIVKITATQKTDIDEYTKNQLKLYNQQIQEVLSSLENINLSDNNNILVYVNTLTEVSTKAISLFENRVDQTSKNLETILNNFKNSLEYLTELETKYNIENVDNLIRYYFAIVSNPVFKEYDNKGNQNNESRKFIAALFNDVIAYQKENFDNYNLNIQNQNTKIAQLKQEIAQTTDNNLKANKQKELVNAQNLLHFYTDLLKDTHFENNGYYKNLDAINELKAAWTNKDFANDENFQYQFEDTALYIRNKTWVDSMNENLQRYQQEKDRFSKSLQNYSSEVHNLATDLFEYVDMFNSFNNIYSNALKQTIFNVKQIKELNIKETVWHHSLLTNEGIEISSKNPLYVAKSKIELLDKLTKAKIVTPETDVNEFARNYIHNVQLTNINKDNSTLSFVLREKQLVNNQEFSSYMNLKYLKFKVNANVSDGVGENTLEQIKQLFDVAGYKAVVQPYSIKEEGSKTIIDDNGQQHTVPTYSIFVEAYDGFTKTLLNKVPWAGEWLEGEHLKTSINDKGEFEYSIENGRYLGLDPDSRIGLWSLLAMNNPKYKGIAVDFLKFVAAHEYGHHMTLNSAQDLGDKGQKPLYGSALVPGQTPNINNYYSRNVLDLYLKARTHLGLNSSPLLNEPNVVSENNEGEYLLYNEPKKINNEIVINKDTVESGSDVWGHEIGKEDLKASMENYKRRFLQTYEGLVKATEERRKANGLNNTEDKKWLEVFDLWLMNTLDQNSGTLNPTKYSDDKFPVKYMTKDANGKWTFKKASLDMLQGILKDGQGNLINFEEVNGQIVPKIVEGIKNSANEYIQIDKILVFNADGSPIINVPLGINLENNDRTNNPYYEINENNENITKKYVNEKIQEAQNTIQSLIVKDFMINGWDFTTTDTSIEPKTSISYPSYAEIFTEADKDYNKAILLPYLDHLKSRDRQTGKIAKGFVDAKYYAPNGTILIDANSEDAIEQEEFYVNAFADKGKENTKFTDILISLYLAEGNSYASISAGARQVLWFSENEQYLPNVNLENVTTPGFLAESFSPQTLKQLHQIPILKWFGPYIKEMVGIDGKNNAYLVVNSNDNVVSENPHPQLKGFPAFWEMSGLKINKNALLNDASNSLFNSYFLEKSNKKLYDFDLKFTTYEEFIKFSSVDTTKAQLNKETKTVNWDIDYVESKFNIDRFKKGLETALLSENTLTSSEKNKLNQLLRENNKQAFANEIMRRFTNSKLAVFVKDIPLSTIKQKIDEDANNELRYAWIFDKDLGYGLFKSEDIVVGTQDNTNTSIEKQWDMSAKRLLDTYNAFANENNVSFDKFSLFDDLILDNKTQMYSTQMIYNFRQRKFSMADILLSFTKGITKKLKPTEDVVNYFKTKTERKFNEFFSDYTYSFAEVINRDNLQITYSPSNTEFRNLPSFITNVNEANTGLEYVVDGTPTAKWNEALIKFTGDEQHSIQNTIIEYEKIADKETKYRASKLNVDYVPNDLINSDNFSSDQNKASNYFGKFKSINNGWFKDRWYRDVLNFRLYDDEGQPIVDDTIRIKDLEGNVVTNRPKAYWEYYIQSQGVGKRNVSNIWRHTDKDAIAMFGYLNIEDAKKVNYLVFEDVETGQRKTLKINKENSSNMFYYKTQHIHNEENSESRHWLKDEAYDYEDSNGHHKGNGFVAWVSDYAIMSNYANKLLDPNHEYKIYFSDDKAGLKTLNIDLGQTQSISENGKTFSQAPTAIYLKNINGTEVPVFRVGVQFNGTK
ncbi:PDxFFG protein [Mycoplasma zalophi]|uniref:PDxFFG protein n=1 Tax=Mycoplasma zalophi TaxID=191287 RepID=UPI001C0FA4EF|nr:PDxFFG protein [Mycoplasma zalophi]MBU4691249.1 PDxFFG protein [Mycoplasma zalophi]